MIGYAIINNVFSDYAVATFENVLNSTSLSSFFQKKYAVIIIGPKITFTA